MKWTCTDARPHLQSMLDGVISRRAGRQLKNHLQQCGGCEAELRQLRRLRSTLGQLGSVAAPDDLALRLKVAISHEAARQQQEPLRERLAFKWKNTGREAALRWSAGLASSFAVLGTLAVLVGMFAAPAAVQASDVPVGIATPAHFLYASFPAAFIATSEDGSILVEAAIGEDGRVYDYRLVAGKLTQEAQAQLENSLYFRQYEPAKVFGQPVRSRVMISFSGVAVHG